MDEFEARYGAYVVGIINDAGEPENVPLTSLNRAQLIEHWHFQFERANEWQQKYVLLRDEYERLIGVKG